MDLMSIKQNPNINQELITLQKITTTISELGELAFEEHSKDYQTKYSELQHQNGRSETKKKQIAINDPKKQKLGSFAQQELQLTLFTQAQYAVELKERIIGHSEKIKKMAKSKKRLEVAQLHREKTMHQVIEDGEPELLQEVNSIKVESAIVAKNATVQDEKIERNSILLQEQKTHLSEKRQKYQEIDKEARSLGIDNQILQSTTFQRPSKFKQSLERKSRIEKEIALIEGRKKVSFGEYTQKKVKLQKTVSTLAAQVQKKNDIWMEHMQEMTDIVDQLKGSYKEIVDPALQRWKEIQNSLVHAHNDNASSHSQKESIQKSEGQTPIEEVLPEDIPKLVEVKKEKELNKELSKDRPFGKPKQKKKFDFPKQTFPETKKEELPEEIEERVDPTPVPPENPIFTNPSTEKQTEKPVPALKSKTHKGKKHFDFPTLPKTEEISQEKVDLPVASVPKPLDPVPSSPVAKGEAIKISSGNKEKNTNFEDIEQFEDVPEKEYNSKKKDIPEIKPEPEKKKFNLHVQQEKKPSVIVPEKKEEPKPVEVS